LGSGLGLALSLIWSYLWNDQMNLWQSIPMTFLKPNKSDMLISTLGTSFHLHFMIS